MANVEKLKAEIDRLGIFGMEINGVFTEKNAWSAIEAIKASDARMSPETDEKELSDLMGRRESDMREGND